MPKVTNTRKQRAAELLRRIETGPASLGETTNIEGSPVTAEEARREYRMWVDTWIVPVIKDLVPELKEKR